MEPAFKKLSPKACLDVLIEEMSGKLTSLRVNGKFILVLVIRLSSKLTFTNQ